MIPYHKTRLAPTPSGFLHLGNVLSFAITAALAKKHSVKILLRIDDLDQARVNKPYLQDIFDTLHFLEIPYDEGPHDVKDFEENYSQLHRMGLYQESLQQLADEGRVFACTCSRSQLTANPCDCLEKKIPQETENASWRFITGANNELAVINYNGGTVRSLLPAEMQNFVVKKKDGFPAYQLTSVIDDLFYGVDLIVRGDDLWPSSLAQQELACALGKTAFADIAFYHHPLIKDTSGQKLSKSAGATSVKYLRENGKTAKEIYAQMAALIGVGENAGNWQQLGEIISAVVNF
jgi:glutamyl-tRNA synthetase